MCRESLWTVNALCGAGQKIKRLHQKMAARLGLEPRQNESESFVLPLHHRAVENRGCVAKPEDPLIAENERGWSAGAQNERGLEPAMGFEPATACLQNRCSTIELRRQGVAAQPNQSDWQKTESGGSPGTRTPNQLIKSQLLYH